MPEPIPIAVFTGKAGPHLGAYFDGLAACPEAGDIVLCDPSGDSLPAARKALGEKLAAVYKDPAVLLKKAAPAMAMVSMEARHAPPVIDMALDAGCHVFAEKPACVRVEDFAPLAAKAEREKRFLMLALANRLNPPVLKARELIDAGTFGTPYGIEIHMIADQTRLTRPSYHESWFADRDRAGGGHLIWLGIHWLDLAMLFTGSRVSEVTGFTGNVGGQPIKAEDSAAIALKFERGMFGTMTSGYYLDKGYHSHIRLWGSKGWIEYTGHLGGLHDPPLTWYTPEGGVQKYQATGEPRGYTPWVRACVRACAGLQAPPITAAESLRALRTVFASYEAAGTGKATTV